MRFGFEGSGCEHGIGRGRVAWLQIVSCSVWFSVSCLVLFNVSCSVLFSVSCLAFSSVLCLVPVKCLGSGVECLWFVI